MEGRRRHGSEAVTPRRARGAGAHLRRLVDPAVLQHQVPRVPRAVQRPLHQHQRPLGLLLLRGVHPATAVLQPRRGRHWVAALSGSGVLLPRVPTTRGPEEGKRQRRLRQQRRLQAQRVRSLGGELGDVARLAQGRAVAAAQDEGAPEGGLAPLEHGQGEADGARADAAGRGPVPLLPRANRLPVALQRRQPAAAAARRSVLRVRPAVGQYAGHGGGAVAVRGGAVAAV